MVSSQNCPLPWYLVTEPPDPPALQVFEDFSNCVEDGTQGLPAVLHPQPKNFCQKCFPQTLKKAVAHAFTPSTKEAEAVCSQSAQLGLQALANLMF